MSRRKTSYLQKKISVNSTCTEKFPASSFKIWFRSRQLISYTSNLAMTVQIHVAIFNPLPENLDFRISFI